MLALSKGIWYYKWALMRQVRAMKKKDAPLAQLDRAFDYGSKGCGFDSCMARHLFKVLIGM